MNFERIGTPAAAVSLDECKAHMRVDHTEEDSSITAMMRTAQSEVEDYAGIALTSQTIRVTLHGWPDVLDMVLPIGPIQDGAPLSVTLDGVAMGGYELSGNKLPRLNLTTEITEDMRNGVVVVEYQAGFSDDATGIPDDLKTAVCDQALQIYELRAGHEFRRSGESLSRHAARIAQRYRRITL